MKTASTFTELYTQLRLRLIPFLAVFFAVIFLTYLVLYIVDFYPEPKEGSENLSDAAAVTVVSEREIEPVAPVTAPTAVAPYPTTITLDRLKRTVAIKNPTASDEATLDRELLSGVVRHPDSADLANPGNMLILGHSSYLPNVLNKNYQAFNGLEDLGWGDTVRVRSADREYVYRVDRVYKAKASEVVVPNDGNEAKLTLVTCNVFGAKEDRYILEASLVETKVL